MFGPRPVHILGRLFKKMLYMQKKSILIEIKQDFTHFLNYFIYLVPKLSERVEAACLIQVMRGWIQLHSVLSANLYQSSKFMFWCHHSRKFNFSHIRNCKWNKKNNAFLNNNGYSSFNFPKIFFKNFLLIKK